MLLLQNESRGIAMTKKQYNLKVNIPRYGKIGDVYGYF